MRVIRLAVLSLALAAGPRLSLAQPTGDDDDDQDEPGDDDDDDDDASDAGDANGTKPDGQKNGTGDSGDTGDTAGPANGGAVPDVDALRRRYFELRDKLFRSRARAASVANALYSTRIQVRLDYKSARHYTITRATIRLDGANVFDNTEGVITQDSAVRFEGYVAPGRHQVTLRIEATGKDDERFTTSTETTISVIAPNGKDLIVDARAADGGDIAYQWQRKTKGTYRLKLDVDVKSEKRQSGKGAGAIKRG